MGSAWARLRLLGPGLIFSGGAIGTSHLVQSTRAGAMFGAALIGVIVLANLLKYPAYRFGVDYSHARGRSLLCGYRELGLWAVLLFLVVLAPLVPIIIAALGMATAGIVTTLAGAVLPIPALAALILAVAAILLIIGRYRWLDRINSVLLAFLTLSTLVTTAMVLPRVDWATLTDITWTTQASALLFIVALVGFMPMPLDVAVPLSLWKVEADRATPPDERPTLAAARRAFASPYVMTALLAVCFCIMGAGVMHPDGIAPLADAPGFAGQIVDLYRSALGDGAATLAAIAALSVMLTTVIVGMDAYARTYASAIAVLAGSADDTGSHRHFSLLCVLFVALAVGALYTLLADFAVFLDFVTSASFLIAPVIALLNHLVVTRCAMNEEARPGPLVRAWNWLAIGLMTALALMYFALTLG